MSLIALNSIFQLTEVAPNRERGGGDEGGEREPELLNWSLGKARNQPGRKENNFENIVSFGILFAKAMGEWV